MKCKLDLRKCSKEVRKEVQEICFSHGVYWADGTKDPLYLDVDLLLNINDRISFPLDTVTFKGSPLPLMSVEDFIATYGPKPRLAERNNAGKMPLSYIFDFPKAMFEFCRVCMNGAKKYKRDNWKKGRLYRDTIDSILRHIKAFQNGEGYYEETLPTGEVVKFHHMANAMWGCAALLEWSLSDRKDLDDRYKHDKTRPEST